VKNDYLQKDLCLETVAPLSETGFRIRPRCSHQDTDCVDSLAYARFKRRAVAGCDVPEADLRARFESLVSRREFVQPHHSLVVAEGDNGCCVGFLWVYTSQADLGSRRYVWMAGLEVSPEHQDEGLEQLLLSQAENWARERGLDAIRTAVHARDDEMCRQLRSVGYVETNLFMQKGVGI
jgi:ribosomal protein S18 acetylase RimI-like enzyme